MALGRYTRVDGKKSTNYCSTVTVVVFVALCLVGVWMISSSSDTAPENFDFPQEKQKTEVKQDKLKQEEVKQDPVKEYNPAHLPEDASKGDSNIKSENPNEAPSEEKKEEKPSDDEKSDDTNNKSETNEQVIEENQNLKKDGFEEANTEHGGNNTGEKKESGEGSSENEKHSEESPSKTQDEKKESEIDEKVEQNQDSESDNSSKMEGGESKEQVAQEVFPSGAQSELLNEFSTQNGSFSTQAAESKNEKETQKSSTQQEKLTWKLCNTTAGPDYIPCLDNWDDIHHLRSTKHYEHRERHCPAEPPTCLVPLPVGYKRPVEWPKSREKVDKSIHQCK